MRLGGGFDVPLQQGAIERRGNLFGQHGLASAGLALNEQGALKCQGSIDRKFEVVGGDVALGTVKTFGLLGIRG